MNTCRNTNTKRIKKNRRFTRGGGISIPIVMALVVAASLAIAVYFIASFMGLGFAVGGTPQYNVQLRKLGVSSFELSIKNIGSVAIKKVNITIYDPATHSLVLFIYLDFDKKAFCVINNSEKITETDKCKDSSVSVNSLRQGQEAVLSCTENSNCILTISGVSKIITLKNDKGAPYKWNSDIISAGEPYDIIVKLYFANGEWRTTTISTTALP